MLGWEGGGTGQGGEGLVGRVVLFGRKNGRKGGREGRKRTKQISKVLALIV